MTRTTAHRATIMSRMKTSEADVRAKQVAYTADADDDPYNRGNDEWCGMDTSPANRIAHLEEQLLDLGGRFQQLEEDEWRCKRHGEAMLERLQLGSVPLQLMCQCGKIHALEPVAYWMQGDFAGQAEERKHEAQAANADPVRDQDISCTVTA